MFFSINQEIPYIVGLFSLVQIYIQTESIKFLSVLFLDGHACTCST